MGIERNLAGVGVLAEHQESAAVAAQFRALGHCSGMTHALDHLVRAERAGQLEGQLAAVHHVRHVVH